jgi:cytidylate kinase
MVAPIEVRVRRIATEGSMTLKAARVEVERSDRERARFSRRHFGHDWHEALNYDVIINTAELTVEAATEVIVTAVQRKLALQLKGSG